LHLAPGDHVFVSPRAAGAIVSDYVI
jgi:hypothetical protein